MQEKIAELKAALKKKDRSLGDFAKEIGRTPSYVSDWFAGKRTPDPFDERGQLAYRVAAKYIGIPTATLILDLMHLEPSDRSTSTVSNEFWKGFSSKGRGSKYLPSLGQDSKLQTLVNNLTCCEEFLDVLNASLRAYVEKHRKLKWIEGADDVEGEIAKRKEGAKKKNPSV